MDIISDKQPHIHQLLSPFSAKSEKLKWSVFNLYCEVEDGLLIYNSLTFCLALLRGKKLAYKDEDPNQHDDKGELKEFCFGVDSEQDEFQTAKETISLLRQMTKREPSSEYAIYSTLGCNARCSYCFENGMPRTAMTEKTAREAAEFIIRTRRSEKVFITWFGGEPTVNPNAIEIVSKTLKDEGVEFNSNIFTNAYLFDKDMAKRAVEIWNLNHAIVTLDGDEKEYNKIKNYPDTKGSPFRRVLENINSLRGEGVSVSIKMNLSEENHQSLLRLADLLAEKFREDDKVGINVFPLYEYFSADEKTQRLLSDLYASLCNRIMDNHLKNGGPRNVFYYSVPSIRPNRGCFIDNPDYYGILPDGRLNKCRNRSAMITVGNIREGVTDKEAESRFYQRVPETYKCRTCFYAPHCIQLEICERKCGLLHLEKIRFDWLARMKHDYHRWREEKLNQK